MKAIQFNSLFQLDKAYIQKDDAASPQDRPRAEGHWIVEGFASTSDLDAQGHIITEDAIKMGAASLKEYQTVLYNHDPNRPIGKVLNSEARGSRLFIKVEISKSEPLIWQKIKDGTLSKFSVKGRILDAAPAKHEETGKNIMMIKGLELHEVSIVSVPANIKARSLAWYVEKALITAQVDDNDEDLEKAKYPFPNCLADRKKDGYSDEDAHRICGAIRARNITHMIEWGEAADENEAIQKIAEKIQSDKSYVYILDKYLAKEGLALAGTHRQPGEPLKDCVGRKIRANVKEGKPQDQAVAIAYSQCGASEKGVQFTAEELELLLKDLDTPEGGDTNVDLNKAKKKTPADEAAEEEAEKAAKLKAKPPVDDEDEEAKKSVARLVNAINALEEMGAEIENAEADAEDVEQIKSVVSALKALGAKRYPRKGGAKPPMAPGMAKAEADRAANSNVKAQSSASGGRKGVGDFWIDGQPGYRKPSTADSNIDPTKSGPGSDNTQKTVDGPLGAAVMQLQAMVKEVTTTAAAVMEAVNQVEEAKSSISKMVMDTQELFKRIPLRKGLGAQDIDGERAQTEKGNEQQAAEVDLEKSLDTIVKDEKMRPGDKLRVMLEKVIASQQ